MTEPIRADVGSILHDLDSAEADAPIRYLLTGESGSGKTIWCSKLVEAAQKSGLVIGGVLSPGVYEGDRRVAIEIRDIGTDERRTLARLRPRPDPTAAIKKWEMDPDVLDWGNSIFSRRAELDLLVVDEIGPLELLHASGLLAAIQAIDRGDYRGAVVVVRPSLLEKASERWPESRVLRLPGLHPSVR
jgi:nucleoside-triphosphatase THEP1